MPPKQAAYEEKLKKRNFTDPDSRIMVSGGTFVQAYNCQAAVDEKAQIILAADVTQDANNKNQTVSMVDQIKIRTGQNPTCLTADSGYYNQHQIERLPRRHRYLHCHPKTQAHRPHSQAATWPHTQERNAQGQNGQKATYDQGSVHLRKEKSISLNPCSDRSNYLAALTASPSEDSKKSPQNGTSSAFTHNLLKLYRTELASQSRIGRRRTSS